MSRITILSATFAALVMLSGCNGTPRPAAPAAKSSVPSVVAPVPTPLVTGTEAQRQADEKLWRDVEEKKRKSKSAYLNKTKAIDTYIP